MGVKDITSMRGVIEFLKEENELLTIEGEVDPILEIAGLQKALECGIALLFENIKGYPGIRNVGNVASTGERLAKIFGVNDAKKLKFKCLEAMNNPVPPEVVREGPCQEVVITKNIDVVSTMPVIMHSEKDAGRIIGGGVILLSGKYFGNGTNVSFNRLHFQGKDWASISTGLEGHLYKSVGIEHRGKKVPVTINICAPPAVNVIAAGGMIHAVNPRGSDELGIAGALQGSPVKICPAKTVDAYAIAESEWVIEGYIDSTVKVWESSESEKIGEQAVAPFFPEWPGYMGRAYRVFKFQATAITHRRDRPIFYTPLAHSFECDTMTKVLREACFWETAQRICPELVVDVNILYGTTTFGSVTFQIKKKRPVDEGYQRNIILSAFGASPGLQLVVVVDEDVDIYCAEDVLWAIATRLDPATGIMRMRGRGHAFLPVQRAGGSGEAIGLDCTAPFSAKSLYERAHYPVDKIALKKWLSDEEITKAVARQTEWAKDLAKYGW